MESKELKLFFRQGPLGDQIKVGHVIFTRTRPGAIYVITLTGHEYDFAPVWFIVGAEIEPSQTRPKNVSQDAIAR